MENSLKDILAKLIQLALQVSKAADEAASYKQDCRHIKQKTKELAQNIGLITQQNIEYDRPFLRIAAEVEQSLDKAHSLVLKCATVNPLHFLVSPPGFMKTSRALDTCIHDVVWLRHIQTCNYECEDPHLPSIVVNDIILARTWSCIARLHNSSLDNHEDTARELLSLSVADEAKKLVIEEGGILPLLNLLKHGRMEEQEVAAMIVGKLGYDLESVEHLIDDGVFTVFTKILKEGPMGVQAEVASAISELAAIHPKCKDICVKNNIIRLLINHLSFEMLQEHIQNFVPINKATTVLGIVSASSYMDKRKILSDDEEQNNRRNHQLTLSLSRENIMNRQLENPETKESRKTMGAKALWHLVKDNDRICRIIIESKALMCFINILALGHEEVEYYSIMALMEITTITEQDVDLKRSIFRPSSPVWTSLIGSIIRLLEKTYPINRIIIPSMKIVSNLAKKFRVAETRIIDVMVKFLDYKNGTDVNLCRESLITLSKLTCKECHLHMEHSKEIISKGGLSHLFQIICFEGRSMEELATVLFCQIASNVPESEELAQLEASNAVEWVNKTLVVTDRKKIFTFAALKLFMMRHKHNQDR